MAQPSKKDFIAEKALPLFLANGIKGTSVDMVVKASGVSKPTVYNHFPDKATLMAHVVDHWLSQQQPPELKADNLEALTNEINKQWLTKEVIRLYGLVMGEGNRAPIAVQHFKEKFDTPWRAELLRWATSQDQSFAELNAMVSHTLVSGLL